MKKIDLAKKIEENKNNQETVLPVMYSYKDKRDIILSGDEKEEFRKELRGIKENSIKDIKNLKQKAIDNFTKNGIKVIEARGPADAKKRISEIIGKEKLIVKSKSNTANEIGLKKFLKNKELVETDLGDFIVQIFGGESMHPVTPAINLLPKDISKKIKQRFGAAVKPTPEDIVKFAREHLRKKIFKAKVGITGANVMSADGSIFILENEGNISLVSRIPEKHIIITSIDKLVKTREEALKITEAAAIFGSGQEYPVYVNIISGPSKTADIQKQLVTGAQGAKEVYLILLDNKRTEILDSEFKELLYCINCGACLNFCPVYHQVFTEYGGKHFSGSKGVIESHFKESPRKAYKNGAFFCTTCRACKENCPMDIDLPELMRKLREKLSKQGIEPDTVEEMIENVKKFGNPFGDLGGKVPDKLYCC